MELKLNTPLNIDEIDFRVQSINKGGYATILAYKDARVDMNRLDAVYGVEYWQKKYDLIDGKLFCSIGIYNKVIQQWIWKQDVGTESMAEKEKGEASDASKRACFNLGIGRELYDYPVIQIKLNANEFEVKNDKVYPTFNFKLKEWVWQSEFDANGKLILLTCKDNNGVVRFNYHTGVVLQNSIPQKEVLTTAKFEAMINTINDGNSESVLKALPKYTVSEQQMKAINIAIEKNKK